MPRSNRPSLVFRPIAWLRLTVAALLVLPGLSVAAPSHSHRWQVVLVAGDRAQPVFDNAIEAVRRWLVRDGVPDGDIYRLSADPVARDPSIEPASLARISYRIASLPVHPGDRCLVFVTSHGQHGEGIWLAYSMEFLTPAALARSLAAACADAPTVVVISGCYSGIFTKPPMTAPNRIILTASRASRPSFGCQVERTFTVYDECLLRALPRSGNWHAVYAAARECVGRREREMGELPSDPQAYFGTAVRDLSVR